MNFPIVYKHNDTIQPHPTHYIEIDIVHCARSHNASRSRSNLLVSPIRFPCIQMSLWLHRGKNVQKIIYDGNKGM